MGMHNANIRSIYEQKVADLEKESQQTKEQLKMSFNEKKSMLDQLERMENEKLAMKQQLSKYERDLQAAKKEIDKVVLEKEEIKFQKLSVDETLCELKECKRAVEIRYKNILSEVSEQSNKYESLVEQNVYLESSNFNLQERVKQLETEKNEQTEILADVQQTLILKSSEYENQIRVMQIELGNRLDEINVVKKEDVDKVKGHYRELFQEKASEVMILRDEAERLNKIIEEYKCKVRDLEYREEELNNIVNKMREGKLTNEDSNEFELRVKESLTNSQNLQEKVNKINDEFIQMKEKSFNQLKNFDFHVQELQEIIRDKDIEIKLLKSNITSDQIDELNTHENKSVSNSSHQRFITNSEITYDMAVKSRNRKKKKKS